MNKTLLAMTAATLVGFSGLAQAQTGFNRIKLGTPHARSVNVSKRMV